MESGILTVRITYTIIADQSLEIHIDQSASARIEASVQAPVRCGKQKVVREDFRADAGRSHYKPRLVT